MVNAAIRGDLEGVEYQTDPIFGLRVPQHCPGVPDEVLQPRATWADGAAYDRRARTLAAKFAENFAKYADNVSEAVRQAGPHGM
jgi:phosphoenolpyruvate carboxykinase (ATP)